MLRRERGRTERILLRLLNDVVELCLSWCLVEERGLNFLFKTFHALVMVRWGYVRLLFRVEVDETVSLRLVPVTLFLGLAPDHQFFPVVVSNLILFHSESIVKFFRGHDHLFDTGQVPFLPEDRAATTSARMSRL